MSNRVMATGYLGVVGMNNNSYLKQLDVAADRRVKEQAEKTQTVNTIIGGLIQRPDILAWAKANNLPQDQVKQVLSTVATTFLGNIRWRVGPEKNTTTTENYQDYTIFNNHTHTIYDHLGKVISSATVRTEKARGTDRLADTVTQSISPVATVGLDFVNISGRPSENLSVYAKASLDAIASIN